jgi:hypothetical protein
MFLTDDNYCDLIWNLFNNLMLLEENTNSTLVYIETHLFHSSDMKQKFK